MVAAEAARRRRRQLQRDSGDRIKVCLCSILFIFIKLSSCPQPPPRSSGTPSPRGRASPSPRVQIIDGVSGGGAMEERSDLGGTCGMTPCHRSSRRIDQQIIKEKIRRDLKWPPNDANTHNNQPNTTRRDGGGIQEDARPAGSAGGVQCDRFGCDRAQLM